MNCRYCAVIPSYNHVRAVPAIVAALQAQGFPVFIVDDGSAEPTKSALAALQDRERHIVVHRFEENAGKGVAVIAGLRLAAAAGFTHAVQIDADGQHDLDALPRLVAASRDRPEALVSGAPAFDSTMPLGRRLGRWITHVWVFAETLSLAITDSMCGFRVYPLAPTLRLAAEETLGRRMDFDTDVMVRLFWRGVRPLMVPVRVTYPAGNTSNFDLWRDNIRITRMHTRLMLSLPFRLPRLLMPRGAVDRGHWALLEERGGYWGLRFLAAVYRLLGRTGCLVALSPIVFYFFITDRNRRVCSQRFLTRVYAARGTTKSPSVFDLYRHFLSFAAQAVDVFGAWIGALAPEAIVSEDPAGLARLAADPRGAVLVVSHLGNAELSRAMLDDRLRDRIGSGDKPELLTPCLLGLAAAAATTRSEQLANELFILIRSYRRFYRGELDIETAFRVGMVACASRSDFGAWCGCVGALVTDLGFGELSADEAAMLDEFVSRMCHCVPELWAACGRGIAAIEAVTRAA